MNKQHNITTLNVTKREGSGKGTAREARRQGMIPGVVYGDKKAPVLFNIEYNALHNLMKKKGFWTTQFEINTGSEKIRTICQDVQLHPVSDKPLHIDFLRISKGSKVHMEIPVVFVNEDKSPGIKNGGVLNIILREIEVVCSPDNIPETIEIDLSGLDLNDVVHSDNIKLPAGVAFTDTEGFSIASINAVVEVKEEEIVAPADTPSEQKVPAEGEKKADAKSAEPKKAEPKKDEKK